MNVTEAVRSGTRVDLPASVAGQFQVYVNGVEQREGADFRVDGRTLVFSRELHHEGRLGFWRWASITFGVAGTYRKHDVVDVAYAAAAGRRAVASNLPLTG